MAAFEVGPATMGWKPLPKGAFTGIAWSRPRATDGFDPYLVWAEASRFSGSHLEQTPVWLPVLLELAPGCSIEQLQKAAHISWLRIPKVYASSAAPKGLRYCTAHVKPEFFRQIKPGAPLHGLVQRFELGLPQSGAYGGGDSTDPPDAADYSASIPSEQRLRGKAIGLIDGGLAFANVRFLASGKARTAFFWRQDAKGVGAPPAGFGFGHELRAADIDQAMRANTYAGMVDEDAVYRQFKLDDLRKNVNHGTQVMDLACGPRTLAAQVAGVPPHPNAPPSWALADDDASRAPLLAVQLDWSNIVDTSGGSMNVSVMDALMYLLSRCHQDASLAVNISWGTLAGPHDGSSVLEAAMDQLMELREGRLHIIVPAGNAYQSRTHANATLAKGRSMPLSWEAPPDDATQSFLEIWLPPGASGVEITVTPPGGRAALPAMPIGRSGLWGDDKAGPACALIYPSHVATGAHGTCALLALAPTFSFKPGVATAPSGTWQVVVTNCGDQPASIDAYIERDDVALGQNTGARQSRFGDTLYNRSGNPDSWVDVPVSLRRQLSATLIRRSGTFNSLSTGEHSISVGGRRLLGHPLPSEASWALYSPQDPDPDASRPQRPGVVKVPKRWAISDENAALWGVRAAGTRSASAVRLVGTSSAAPQITREIFNGLAAAPPRSYQRAGRVRSSTMRRSSKTR